MSGIIPQIDALTAEMTGWRRDIHQHPELGFEEQRTAAIIAEKLQAWGIETHSGVARTGVVGVIHGKNGPGGAEKSIALRADMDALPMEEANQFEHRSRHNGKFHGCGHDGHTTMLLGAAKYLADHRDEFDGTVYCLFQPAEEGMGGGRVMVREGIFDKFPVKSVWGMHNWPEMPFGTAAVQPGPMMAGADRFTITVRGKGVHAAFPHKGIDPVLTGAHIVTALQSLVSRNVDPLDQGVVSVTQFHAGSAFNVIGDEAMLGGTLRSFRPETRQRLVDGVHGIAQNIAQAFGAEAVVDFAEGYPPTINSAAEAVFAAGVAGQILGAAQVKTEFDPCMGAEDFSYMLMERPGAYIWLGQGAGGPTSAMLHNPGYDFNDALLPVGASYWARLVAAALPRRAA